MNNKRILWSLVLLCGGMGIWFVVSPYFTMLKIVDAVRAGDTEVLSERIDFPLIRENLKSGLKAEMSFQMAKEADNNPFAALGGLLAAKMVDSFLDMVITPEGLVGIMREKNSPAQDISKGKLLGKMISCSSFSSLDRFVLKIPDKDSSGEIQIVLKRSGFSWRVMHIKVPFDEIRKLQKSDKVGA